MHASGQSASRYHRRVGHLGHRLGLGDRRHLPDLSDQRYNRLVRICHLFPCVYCLLYCSLGLLGRGRRGVDFGLACREPVGDRLHDLRALRLGYVRQDTEGQAIDMARWVST